MISDIVTKTRSVRCLLLLRGCRHGCWSPSFCKSIQVFAEGSGRLMQGRRGSEGWSPGERQKPKESRVSFLSAPGSLTPDSSKQIGPEPWEV